ncbi:F0F1 ATP synthase subunit delta [Microgenomates group bacterium]|nr:F0F1 ATP synthase subunit delta [Microgenomates group bacterium]
MPYFSSTTIAKNLLPLTQKGSRQEIEAVIEVLMKELRRHKKMDQLERIVSLLQTYADEKEGTVRARVSSDAALSNTQTKQITDFLKGKVRAKKIILETMIDAEQRGLTIQVNDDLYDLTLKSQLEKLTKQLNT